MSIQYSLRGFLRAAPVPVLRRYLRSVALDVELPDKAGRRVAVDRVAATLERLPAETPNTIEADFRRVHQLANEVGMKALRQELAHSELPTLDNPDGRRAGMLEIAFRALIDHREDYPGHL